MAHPATAEPLKVVGYFKVIEMAPMHIAAESMPEGSIELYGGAIPSLWPGVVDAVAPSATKDTADVPNLAGNAETQALRQSVAHPDLRILMTITEGMYRMIARKSSGVRSPADLRGKRIATVPSSSAAFYVHQMLARVGLTEDDVTILMGKAPDAANMLLDDRADVLAVWEPGPEGVRQLLGDESVELNEFGVYRELYNLNTTTATLADPVKRAQTVAFVRALMRACHEATYNPARAQGLTAASTGYALPLVRAAWPHHRFSCYLPTDLLDVLTQEEQWLAKQDGREPRGRDELARLIDPSILAEALGE
jgi:NitT/TauT family transport system substrate-binding protein